MYVENMYRALDSVKWDYSR
uniref:Uncharacterized protein n=1 Tax=Anguilla anguilla TaxID=7936 RepID=A0A0E9UBT9_ANGAN